ncbi:MAG TPA: hypothetical protein VIF60_19815 [Burkholderiaceae bacterium]|jgi:hypothetical protein
MALYFRKNPCIRYRGFSVVAKFKLKRLTDFNDMISIIYVSAPNGFPKVGAFVGNHKENLSVAFQLLADAFPLVEKKIKSPDQLAELKEMLSDALDAYQQGDNIRGGELLSKLQIIVSPRLVKEYQERKGE